MSRTVRRSRSAVWALVATLVAVVVAGCAKDRQSVVQPSPSVTTSPPVAMTTVPTTAPPTVLPTTLPVTTGIVLPPDLGRLVPSAPGVSTPGDIWQLAPKLWLFLSSDAAGDPNLTPPSPDDAEILIAYARKQKALQLAGASGDLKLKSSDVAAAYTISGLAGRVGALAPRANEGHRLDLGDGIVYRPRVASEPRSSSSALVIDCTLDTSFWVAASGAPTNDTPRSAGPFGVFASLVHETDGWVVDADGPEEFACAS